MHPQAPGLPPPAVQTRVESGVASLFLSTRYWIHASLLLHDQVQQFGFPSSPAYFAEVASALRGNVVPFLFYWSGLYNHYVFWNPVCRRWLSGPAELPAEPYYSTPVATCAIFAGENGPTYGSLILRPQYTCIGDPNQDIVIEYDTVCAHDEVEAMVGIESAVSTEENAVVPYSGGNAQLTAHVGALSLSNTTFSSGSTTEVPSILGYVGTDAADRDVEMIDEAKRQKWVDLFLRRRM